MAPVLVKSTPWRFSESPGGFIHVVTVHSFVISQCQRLEQRPEPDRFQVSEITMDQAAGHPYPELKAQLKTPDRFCAELCNITRLVSSFSDENLVVRQHLKLRLPALASGHGPKVQNWRLADC